MAKAKSPKPAVTAKPAKPAEPAKSVASAKPVASAKSAGTAKAVRRRRRAPIWFGALAGVLVLAIVAAWSSRLTLAERMALAAADYLGLPAMTLTVERLDFDGLRLRDVRLGPSGELSLATATLAYTVGGLSDGRVERIEIAGLRVALDFDGASLTVAGFSPTPSAAGGEADGDWAPPAMLFGVPPFDALDLTDLRIALNTPDGPATLTGEATIEPEAPGRARVLLDFDLAAGEARGRLTGRGTVDAQADGSAAARLALRLDGTGFGGAFDGVAEIEIRQDAAGALALDSTWRDLSLAYGDNALIDAVGEFSATLAEGELGAIDLRTQAERARVLGYDLGAIDLDLARVGERIDANLEIRGPLGQFTLLATLDARAPLENAIALSAGGTLDASALTQLVPGMPAMNGRIDIGIEASIDDPSRLAFPLDANAPPAISAYGAVDLDLSAAASEPAKAASLQGALDFEFDGERALLTSRPEGVELQLPPLGPALLTALPSDLRARLGQAISVDLGGEGRSPVTLDFRLRDRRARLVGGARVAIGGDGAVLEADATLTLDEAMAPERLSADYLSLRAENIRYREIRSDIEILATDLDLDAEGGSAEIALGLGARGRVLDTRFETLSLDLTARVDGDARTLSIRPEPGARLIVAGLRQGARISATTPIALSLRASPAPRISIERATGATSFALGVDAAPIGLDLGEIAGERRFLELVLPRARITLDDTALLLAATEGALAIPSAALRARGLSFDLVWPRGGRAKAALAVGSIAIERRPMPVIPLALTGSVADTGGALEFEFRLADPGERLVIELAGRHALDSGAGSATFASKRMTFLPTVLHPKQLFPFLPDGAREVDGAIDIKGALAWDEESVDGEAELLAQLNRLTYDDLKVVGAEAVIRFDGLFPPRTPPDQVIAVERIDLGMPIDNGRVLFQLDPEGRVTARLSELDLFGGRVSSEPVTFDVRDPDFTLVMNATGVRIEQMIKTTEIGEIVATGSLAGRIPVRVRGTEIDIREGVLETQDGGGQLSYRPRAVGAALAEANEGTALFLRAIERFDYDKIRLTLEEGNLRNMVMVLMIEGRSLNVYGGDIPVQLNIRLDGPLERILERGLATYRLPEKLRERIAGFGE